MTERSKAQRLADILQHKIPSVECLKQAAAELRRLDALNAELVEALEEAHDLCLDAYCSQAREVIVHALNKAKEQT